MISRHTSIGCLLLLTFAPSAVAEERLDPLARYVDREDRSFHWAVRAERLVGQTEVVELIVTSQTWREIEWKHQLFIIKPSTATSETKQGLLLIEGGRWRKSFEEPGRPISLPPEAALFSAIAEQFKCPVTVLLQVPHQPVFGGMVEDEIIAFTMEKFLETGEDDWLLLLPMAKSAVRAMDVVQQVCRKKWEMQLESFTVTGASKRGWTTWLTAAVDERVTAIAPMVIDHLNMEQQMQHQKDSWGRLSEKIHDYTDRRLTDRLQTKEGRKLQKIVDPYSYRDRLTQPKLMIIGTNDHYWPLDALNLYWDDLVGEKYILYVPNNRHGLTDFVRIVGSIKAVHDQAADGRKVPQLSWNFSVNGDNGSLDLLATEKPGKVRAWHATSPSRDFRAARWRSRPMREDGGRYVHDWATPETGYLAVFGEAVFRLDEVPCFLSTTVRILGPPEE